MANLTCGSFSLVEKAISFVFSGTSSTQYLLQYWVVRYSKSFRKMMLLETNTVSSARAMAEIVVPMMETPRLDS